jgi:hypothetical protein
MYVPERFIKSNPAHDFNQDVGLSGNEETERDHHVDKPFGFIY